MISLSNLQSAKKSFESNLQSRDNSRNFFVFFKINLDSKLLKIIILLSSLIRLSNDNFNNLSDKIEEQKNSIKKLVVHYLLKEKINKKPLNQVSRFHLGNGASIDDVIINGNTTDYGYKESFGIMVNYIYKLDKLEKIHEDYINHKIISYSDKIKKYV